MLLSTRSSQQALDFYTTRTAVLLLTSLSWLMTCSGATPVFTESPTSVTSLVGEQARFTCAGGEAGVPADQLDLTWFVNDQIVDASSECCTQDTIPSSDIVQSNLTITATPENDGATVKCRIGGISGQAAISNSSTLTVLYDEQDCNTTVNCTAISSTALGIPFHTKSTFLPYSTQGSGTSNATVPVTPTTTPPSTHTVSIVVGVSVTLFVACCIVFPFLIGVIAFLCCKGSKRKTMSLVVHKFSSTPNQPSTPDQPSCPLETKKPQLHSKQNHSSSGYSSAIAEESGESSGNQEIIRVPTFNGVNTSMSRVSSTDDEFYIVPQMTMDSGESSSKKACDLPRNTMHVAVPSPSIPNDMELNNSPFLSKNEHGNDCHSC